MIPTNYYIININLIRWNWGYFIFRQTQMLVPFRPQPAPAAPQGPQGHAMFLGQVECGPHWWLGRLGLGLYDPKDMNKHGLCMLVFDVWSMWSTALCLDVCFRKTGLLIPVSKLQGFLLEKKTPQTSFGPSLWYINRLWYCFSNICIYIVTHFWPRRWFGVCFWRNPEIFEAFRPW